MNQNIQNRTYITIRIHNITIKTYNIQNNKEAHNTHNNIHNDKKKEPKEHERM